MPKKKPPAWPAHNVETWPVAKIKPNPKNSRVHSKAQLQEIANSITEWGFTNRPLIDERGVLIAGEGRWLAAKDILGLKEVPVIVARGWSAAQKRAYLIADNRLTEKGEWNQEVLRMELSDLALGGFDITLTGFTLADLAPASGNTDPEATPKPPVTPASKLGDVWICGDHRVICGDATNGEDVANLLAGAKPNVMVTDPPYGVNYDPTWRVDTNRFARGSESHGKVENDDRADWRDAWALFPGDVAYVWCASMTNDAVIASLEAAKVVRRAQIIWAKQHFTFGRGAYHWQHECCWYAVRIGGKAGWTGDRKQTTVWEIPNPNPMGGSRDDGQTGHSTQKPVECMARPIRNHSKPGDAIYDPFLGSGTTMIAAEMERRACLGIEINPAYVDVIVTRWQAFTGGKATLHGDGQSFDEIAAARKKKPAHKAPASKRKAVASVAAPA